MARSQYDVSIDTIIVSRIASLDADTLYACISTSVAGETPKTTPVRVGRFGPLATIPAPLNLIDGTPPAEDNDSVLINFYIMNKGDNNDPQTFFHQFSNTASDVASVFLTVLYGNGNGWDKLNQITKTLNDKYIFSGCDCVVAFDTLNMIGSDLEVLTSATGSYTQTLYFEQGKTGLFCNDQGPGYIVWFTITRQGGGTRQYFKIVNKSSGKVLDVYQKVTDDGAVIAQNAYNGGDNQLWWLQPQGQEGYFCIESKQSSKVIDIPNALANPGAAMQLYHYNKEPGKGDMNQRWKLIPLGGGFFKICSRLNPKLVLDVPNYSDQDGARIVIQTDQVGDDTSGSSNQQWSFVPVEMRLPWPDLVPVGDGGGGGGNPGVPIG